MDRGTRGRDAPRLRVATAEAPDPAHKQTSPGDPNPTAF